MAKAKEQLVARLADSASPVLLLGERGTGKQHLAQVAADVLGVPFHSLDCGGGDLPRLRSWLFEAVFAEGGVQPGMVGRSSNSVLYLGALESAPESLLRDLELLITERTYIDGAQRIYPSPPGIRLLGGYTVTPGILPDFQKHFVRTIHTRIEVPPLRDRLEDLEGLADHFLSEGGITGSWEPSAIEALAQVDFSESNVDQLKRLVSRAADLASRAEKPLAITSRILSEAVFQELTFLVPGFQYREHTLGAGHLRSWIEQFPPDLQFAAHQLIQACRTKYYCDQRLWWERLRTVDRTLREEVGGPRPSMRATVAERVVLGLVQRPGKSESRVIADFLKAAYLPPTTLRLTPKQVLAELKRPRNQVPHNPVFVILDDWVGSGEQMKKALDRHADALIAIQSECVKRGSKFRLRILTVGSYVDALRKIAESSVWNHLDCRFHTAWELREGDRCVGDNSELILDSRLRSRLEAFAKKKGKRLAREFPLGWPPGGLLVMFQHDVPNNSLPLLWAERQGEWSALAPRGPQRSPYTGAR